MDQYLQEEALLLSLAMDEDEHDEPLGNSVDFTTPDMETRRRQLAEAADKRQQEQENRGIKDPEKVKRMKQRSEEMERRQEEAARHGGSGSELKWQVTS